MTSVAPTSDAPSDVAPTSDAPSDIAPTSDAPSDIAPTSASSDIAAHLMRINHTFGRFRACVQAADANWQLNYLLFQVLKHGPLRSSALADLAQIDPSTVSRQVATLVKQGLLERRADQDDGRAVLLHPTDVALARHRRHLAERESHYRRMLSDWTADDQRHFADLLARFGDSFDAYRPTFLAEITAPPGANPPAERERHV